MKAQPLGQRWLAALLLIGLVTQSAVAATHAVLPVHPGAVHEQPADGEERTGHDPASCTFCRAAPASEHGLFVSPLALPIGADAIRRSVDAIVEPPRRALWAPTAPRAPPFPPNA